MKEKFLIIEHQPRQLCEGLENFGFEVVERPGITYKQLYDIIEDFTGIVISSRLRVDRKFLSSAPKLRYVLRPGSGLENVDLKLTQQKNILCINSPEGNRDAVAEHAIGMILNLFNHIQRANLEVKNGVWLRENNRGLELKGKTIGIIGYGNTGQALAKKLSGFEMNILAYDKYHNDRNKWVRDAQMKEIFEKADIVSFHLPLTDETRYIANDQFFRNFRKAIYVINTSRGPIVQTSSLIKALERNAVLGACLDVLENEKIYALTEQQEKEFEFLRNSEKVILTPHIAGWTYASKIRMVTELLRKFEHELKLSV